ncbi:MAG: PKD domain-containing protein [Flavobacteriales bacterium]
MGRRWSSRRERRRLLYAYAAAAGVGAHTLLYRYTDVVTTCSDTAYKNVTVNPLPTSSFSVPSDACVNSAITPSNSSTGAASYSWNFGEGTDVPGTAPSHSYNTLGDYDIRLIATSNTSCKDTSYQTIHVVSAPTLVLSADVTDGCGPLDVNFSTNITGLVSSYAWNFGNATGSAAANPGTQVYTASTSAAAYTAQLTVSNACGVATDDVQITVQPQPVASFNSVITSTVCSPVSVEFENTSIGDVSNCTWDFGDGEVLVVDDPEDRIYTTTGGPTTYTVELSVSNSCGTSTTTQDITVQPNLVHASINASLEEGCTPFVVDLANNGTGGTSFTYEYSNANTQVGSDVQYTFDAAGEFTVYQYATDGCGFDTAFVVLTALQTPQVEFIASADEACAYGEFTFDANVVGASQIEWTFGDGDTSNNDIVNKSYTTGGSYIVTLQGVADNQCSSSTSMEVDIHSNPVAQFSVASNQGCAPFDICPLNGSVGATTTHWDFGDGIVSNETQPCHTFQNFGQSVESNNVILTIENTFGCSDSYELQVDVNPLPPSDFELGQISSCEFPIFLDPISVEDGALAYNWTVDGDPASSDQHPNLLFATPGSFYVQLVTANEYGCTKMSDATFVVNEPAVANFEVDKNNGCLDLLVNFTNTSTNGSSYSWDFGDGDASQSIQPSHTYDDQGVFDVTLTVTSPDGCVDTKTLHNVVETYPLPVADFRPSLTETSIFSPSVEFENQSEDGVEYQWYFGGSATSHEENPIYEFTAPGHWAVTLVTTNMFGCEDRITKNVTITNDFQVYIPNSFTPNNDGLNDVFKPELDGRDFITKYQFTVFNRWGEKVFETKDPKLAWTGDSKSNGYYSPNETFSYQLVIQLEQSAETKVYRGLVTMVR